MAAMVAFVIGESWTMPEIGSLSITSDGYLVGYPMTAGMLGHSEFYGSADDLERNVHNLLDVADLTDEERSQWDKLYTDRIEDWRHY